MIKRWPVLVLPVALLLLVGVAYAANLLTNGDFTGSLTPWTSTGGGAYWTGSVGHDALGAVYAQCTSSCIYGVYQNFSVTQSGVHEVSLWARRYTGSTGGNSLIHLYQDGSSNMPWYYNPGSTSWTETTRYGGFDDGSTYQMRMLAASTGHKVYWDDALVEYQRDFYTIDGNRITNGGFDGSLWNWNGGYAYYPQDGDLDYGYALLSNSTVMTHAFSITTGGAYSLGVSAGYHSSGGLNTLYYRIKRLGSGTTAVSFACYEPASGWNQCYAPYSFSPDDYYLELDSSATSILADDAYVVPQFEISSPPAVPTYTADAYIYYPYEQYDLWSTYQVYSDTTWYGDPYQAWTVWRLRPGAPVYPVATLDIEEVGVNTNGYYIVAWINAWPDVPSTTVRYEGLASVSVAAGQRVGVNCQLGTVGVNRVLGEYHLLLYVEFAGYSINPVPWMTTYPTPGYCNLVDPALGETTGPGAGEVPSILIEVCQACNPPATWTNFGRWIAWLWCQIQNLFTCLLAEWINQIVDLQIMALTQAIASADAMQARINDVLGVNVMLLARVVDTGAWLVEPVNNGMAWLSGLATDALTFATNWIDHQVDQAAYTAGQIENVIMAVSNVGNDIIVLDLEAGGGSGATVWDVLLSLIGLLRDLLLALLDLADTLIQFAVNVFELLLMILGGLTNSIETAESVDLVNFALTGSTDADSMPEEEYEEFEIFGEDPEPAEQFSGSLCGNPAGSVWSVDGPTIAKGACWFVGGAILADTIAFESLLYYVLWAFVGALVILLLAWVLGISPETLKGLFR